MDTIQLIQLLFLVLLLFLAKKESERPSKIREIASKYGLSYSNPPAPSFTLSSSDKSNIIEGNIGNKKVLVYDFDGVPPLKYSFSIGSSMLTTKRYTMVCVDGVERKIQGWLGFASIEKIDSILTDLTKTDIK